MKYCCDCAYMDTVEGEGKNVGLYPCTNKKIKDKYVSARKVAKGGYEPFCPGFLEAFNHTRCEWDREQYMKESKRHGYYIVSAITKLLGLETDNEYLTSFQYLKDVVLPILNPELIEEYDRIGPELADKLLGEDNNVELASYLLYKYLVDMCERIQDREYYEAIDSFKKLLKELKARYLGQPIVLKSEN